MSLSAAAAAMGLPEALVERSAAARAAETGASVDEILAAWAGGEAAPAGAEAVAEAQATARNGEETKAEEQAPSTPEADVPAPEPVTASVEPIAAPGAPTAPTRAPLPAEVTAAQAAHLPEVTTVPTAGIRERTNFVIPRWLTGLMIVAPLFALFALGGSATGACGEATELASDIITGEIVNCDGSEFTGGAVGGRGTDFVTLGAGIFAGSEVAGVNCSGCHGAGGQGSATGPPLTGVLTTFGSCSDHTEWVTLGTTGFQAAGRSTYGDTGKTVGGFGTMPSFSGSLTAEQIAAVAAFERVRFGGEDTDTALVDCGLVEPEGSEGENATEGTVTDGETAPEVAGNGP